MITQLSGSVIERRPGRIVLDVGGVGYEILVPLSWAPPESGSRIRLHTHLQIREDSHTLFGFGTKEEREIFRMAITVSGIGPRIAMNLLGHLSVEDLRAAVGAADIKSLSRIPGLGRRLAERLAVELRDKFKTAAPPPQGVPPAETAVQDAIAALVTLGYKAGEAARRVEGARAMLGADAPADRIIQASLSG